MAFRVDDGDIDPTGICLAPPDIIAGGKRRVSGICSQLRKGIRFDLEQILGIGCFRTVGIGPETDTGQE